MLFMTIGQIVPKHIHEAYRRFQKGVSAPEGVNIVDRVFEADGHRFFVLHNSDSAVAMAKMTRDWEDIATFETVPVLTDAELAATLKK